jgi:FO synthase
MGGDLARRVGPQPRRRECGDRSFRRDPFALAGRVEVVEVLAEQLGDEGTAEMLRSGANDLGGTLMEETISRMAGSSFGSRRSAADLVSLAAGIGRPARQRTTLYGDVGSSAVA